MKILELRKNGTNSNGITLVALVISIIVLLILATVTIQTLTGNNGLLTKAETAVQSNKDSQELEKIKLAVAAAKLAGQGSITTDNLNGEIRENFSDNSINVDEKSGGWFFKKNKEYTIYEDGKVEEGNLLPLLPNEYQQVEYIESSGTQYIFIGEVQMSNLTAEIQFYNFPNNCGYSGGMDCYGNQGRLALGIDIDSNSLNYKFLYGDQSDISSGIKADSQKHIYIINISKENIKTAELYVDNIYLYSLTAKNISHPLYFTLFAYTGWGNTTPNKFCSCRIYKFELEGQIKLYPCYRKSDNAIGMYDMINNKFYTNQGTGTFGYGMEDGTYVAPKNN